MARRRRWWLGVSAALLLLLLVVLLPVRRWTSAPPKVGPTAVAEPLPVTAAPGAPVSAQGPGGADGPARPPAPLAELGAVGDGGSATPRRLRGHLLIDACEEPVPEGELEAPEGLRVEVAGAARVAYATDWLDRRAARALAVDVDAALAEAAELLGSEPRRDLLVVTWPDQESMAEAKGGVSWALAMYDGAVHVAADSSERSLRHEVLHAQLHATAPCVPYWLDEGLAAFFEGAPGNRALTWLRMIRTPLWIPFGSLAEPLRDDEGADAMEPAEVALLYAQSLAMATMLIEDGGPDALERALAASNTGTTRRHLWSHMEPGVDGSRLVDFLARQLFPELDSGQRAELKGAGFRCRGTKPDGLPQCEPIWARAQPRRAE